MNQFVCINNNCSDYLKKVIKPISPKKVFLVTGKESYTNSGSEEFIQEVLLNTDTVIFSDFSKNPKINDVLRGIELFKKHQCNLVIAIGGGSVIDMAKLINIFAHQQCNPFEIIDNNKKITEKGIPFIAIPTTAGSGSEATHFAVLYVDNQKYSVAHKFMLPDYAIIHSDFTYNIPSYSAACSGVDALCQAIEAMWSINSTEESIAYSKEAIKLIKEHLSKAVHNNNQESRKAMSKASFLAGKAINIAKTTAPHALSYSFTIMYDIPHGHAVALTLPSFIEYNYNVTEKDCNDKRGVSFIKKNIEEICYLFKTSPDNSKGFFTDFFKSLGLDLSIKKLIKDKFDLSAIIDSVNIERLNNNPREISKKTICNLLNQ